MIYVNFHLGDWLASTQLLSATERGVYMDLLVVYYTNEHPITQEQCKRIARAYAPAEQEAMHYVLQTFFKEENGAYTHSRCDREIKSAVVIKEKRARAAKSRWAKGQGEKPEGKPEEAMQMDMHVQSTCNASAMEPNTQYPIPNTQINREREREAGASSPARRKRASACPFEPGETIPEDYREVADEKRVADPQRVFNAFVDHAKATGRTLQDWKAGWRMWCGKELEFHPQAAKKETAAERGHRLGLF